MLLKSFRRPLRAIRNQLPPLNFITIHYAYFLATCLIGAVIFWGASTPARSVSFTDALFLVVSAMTLAGLNTVNLSTLNTFQQFMLFALIMLGSAIWVSGFVVLIRKNAFEKKFNDITTGHHSRPRSRSSFARQRRQIISEQKDDAKEEESAIADSPDSASKHISHNRDATPPARRGAPEMNGISSATGQPIERVDSPDSVEPNEAISPHPGLTFRGDTRFEHGPSARRPHRSSFLNLQGVGARPDATLWNNQLARTTSAAVSEQTVIPTSRSDIGRYFETVGGWVSRNSEFHGLTMHEREKLGGYEYRAVSFLAWLVPLYFILWQLLGCLGCGAWVALNQPDTAYDNGLNPWWVGAFNAVSAFNNSGMSLLDANMTAFSTSFYLLITMSLLILAGNTCYPIFLRLIVWSMYKTSSKMTGPTWQERTKTLRFLLDHPRRCYTNLFPSQHTWWLALSVFTLNGIDWAAYEILNIGNSLIDNSYPTNIRVIDGLFQAFAVRSGGFYVVPIPSLRISLLVLYVVMMYISVYPVVITMRNSNVYEERSLGIYADDPETEESAPAAATTKSTPGQYLRRAATLANHHFAPAGSTDSNKHFVRQQLRAQLAHDVWWMVMALFLIMIIENQKFVDDPVNFSVFNFIFEIVSAYGCVGISVGVPYDAYSFCGAWQTLSKLILCAVMLRGRHRGLPVAIDKAVLLPGRGEAEEDDGRIRMARTVSRGKPETV